MPIIHFINNKTQTAGGMRNVLNYVSRKEKTVSEDKRFVTGVNRSPETALDEMTATKNLYHKHKLSLKAVKWIVVSQSVLIALSAALHLWLR